MNQLYSSLNISKQAVVKGQAWLLDILAQVRKDHPTMSCVGLFYRINPLAIGRDKFVAFCMKLGFRSAVARNPWRTTNSSGVIRFPNLVKNLKIIHLDQVWSSDITYLDVRGVFYFITFIIDNYSRRIIGWSVSSRLKTEHTTLPALKKARATRGGKLRLGIILHSDGGGQYYHKDFMAYANKTLKIQNSICEYAWENGIEECINGVIKNNYLRYCDITSLNMLMRSIDRTVTLYNTEKPHKSLKYKTPIQFERNVYFELESQTKEHAPNNPIPP